MIKAFTKLSKQLLLDMCKPKFESDKDLSLQPEFKDYRKCSKTCPWYFENKSTCKVCATCPFVLSTSSIKIARKDVLTFTQIKQLLLYHSMIYENNGLTPLINHEYVASKIDCSVKTARENIKALENAGYIVTRNEGSSYVAFIIKYNKYHISERGYFNLNDKLMNYILKTSNINELRLSLYCLVKLDDMKVQKGKNKKSNIIKKFTYESLLNILPSYIYTKKQLKSLLSDLANNLNILNIKFEKDEIILSESDANNNVFMKGISKINKKALKHFMSRFALSLNEEDKKDLEQMQLQYNNTIIENALATYSKRLLNSQNNTDKNINNFGGYLRTLIKSTILNNLFISNY